MAKWIIYKHRRDLPSVVFEVNDKKEAVEVARFRQPNEHERDPGFSPFQMIFETDDDKVAQKLEERGYIVKQVRRRKVSMNTKGDTQNGQL